MLQIKKMRKEYDELRVIEGTASVKDVLAVSREKGVSMTVLLTAVYLCAIHEEMSKLQEKRPVILMVPVNLRKVFPSDSMLNFFGYIEPFHKFGEGRDEFSQILEEVKEYFDENGIMLTGYQTIENEHYLFDKEDGKMQTGIVDVDGKKRYFADTTGQEKMDG